MTIKLMQGDCLEVMKEIESGSALVILPDSQGHWELISDGESSFWDVYVRRNYPRAGIDCPYATNNNQTDPCMWLGGDDAMWRKISDEYQGRLAI